MNKNIVWFAVIALIAFVGLTSCGDTRASKLEDAKIALDNRDFAKAIALTTELLDSSGDGAVTDQDALTADDAEAAHILASAHFGEAGIDLIAMLDLADKNGGAGKPSVLAKTEGCISDTNFKTVSDLIPSIVTQKNLNNIELGLVVIDLVISKNLVSNPDKLKQEHLLKAIGNAARIIVAIIVATDKIPPIGDNRPDTNVSVTEMNILAPKVFDSFLNTVEALAATGIFSSDLSRAINALKASMIGNSGVVNNTVKTNLFVYIQGIITQCQPSS